MALAAVLEAMADLHLSASDVVERVLAVYEVVQVLIEAEENSEYQVEKLLLESEKA